MGQADTQCGNRKTHDLLLANGAPAESYRDDGNRWLFRNGNGGKGLPPQEPCAAVLTGGPVVDAVWRRLLDRTGPRPAAALFAGIDGACQLELLLGGATHYPLLATAARRVAA